MNLQESLNSAIQKMENAKEAYEWLKRNEKESDTKEQERQFVVFKEINTVPDILLRCFAYEKRIPCYECKYNKKEKEYYEIDVKNLGTLTYAYKICGSILYYNSKHPQNAYLEDVDFAAFFDEKKNIRNLNTHVGVRGVLQDGFRIFKNLNKILLALDCNTERKTVSLSEEPGEFDFSKFYACMDDMNADERKFILIADSMHDVDRKEISSFLSIPWSMIIDYDGASNYGGMETVMNEYGILYNKYQENEFVVNNNISYYPGRIMYVSLCSDSDFRSQFRAPGKQGPSLESNWIRTAINKVRNTRTRGTVVVAGAQSNRTREIIGFIRTEFKEIDVIYLSRQDENVNLIENTDEEYWEDTGNIACVNQFDCSIFEALRRIHANKSLLPIRNEFSMVQNDAVYYVHTLGGEKIGINDKMQIQKLEQYFEFVHLDIGNDEKEGNEWKFFHGDTVSWATIRNGNLPVLSVKAQDFVNSIRRDVYNKCYYIYHSPGIGGSTLGRQICWKLSRVMPVVIAKKYCNIQMLNSLLHDLYIHLFLKNPFLILIDENFFSENEMQDIEMAITNSDYRVNAILVKRISESEARRHYKHSKERELLFTRLEPEKREQLKARCYELLQRDGQGEKYDDRVKALEETIDEKERYALLINLYLLEENFKLETYVKRFLEQIPDDSDGKRMTDLLIFTALGSYFSNNVRIPISYYSEYLLLEQSRDYINDKTRKSSVEKLFTVYEEGLLLKLSEQDNKWYGVKHYLIAQEMLKQLIGGEHWETGLADYSYRFIDMLKDLSKGRNEIDEVIIDMITALFTDKTRDREPRINGEFTALLDAIDDPAKIEIILYLADKFENIIKSNVPAGEGRAEYKLLAHIYAQCARVRSKCLLITEDTINEKEVDEWIGKTVDLVYDEGIYEYDLEDMLGRCYLERIKRFSKEENFDNNIESIIKNIDNAIEHFNKTIWYGSASYGIPGKLEAIWRGIEIIKVWKEWGEEHLIEKLYEDEKARTYLEMGNELIREVDEYEMSTQGRVRMLNEKERFEQTCSPLEPSMLIQDLENLRVKLDPKDYVSQYAVSSGMVNAYERKYYTKSNEYRRSQLIYSALHGDVSAQKDARKVFEHLDLLVKLGNSHEVSYTSYKCWFEYAKYLEVSLVRAWDVALQWKTKELSRVKYNSLYDNNLIRPYYYLFVITLLRYSNNQGMTEKDVLERKDELNRQIKRTSRNTSAVQDWLALGKGMGQLYDRSWINLSDVDSEASIRVVKGKVVYYDENNRGYMRISNPRALSSWGKPPIGGRYSKDSDVFFDGKQSSVISEMDVGNGQEKEFKVGFSYERMVASTNSLERNIKKSSIIMEPASKIEEKRLVSESDEITGKVLLFFPDELVQSYPNSYLNGSLPNGMRGGIGTQDIEKYDSEEISKYGDSLDILQKLQQIGNFEVIVENCKNSKRCRLSLHRTGKSLSEVLSKQPQEKLEVKVPAMKINEIVSGGEKQTEKKILPFLKKDTDLLLFDYQIKGKQICGFIRINGYRESFPAVVPSVTKKMMKTLKDKTRLPVKYVSKNEKQYILKLK